MKFSLRQLSLIPVLFFYLFDLGNIGSLRQGTEGFYLQISKEMYHSSSFLTPLYMGAHHWSKPPLQFWLSHLFYFLFGSTSLGVARFAMAVFSLLAISLLARWFARTFKTSALATFIYFCATIGVLKYSRIYMMEMPLTLLTALGAAYLFQFLLDSKRKSFFLAAGFLGLSVLIKGPVSLVMAGGAAGMYLVYSHFLKLPSPLLKIIKVFSLATVIGGIWFVICTSIYGREFIDYFFLRENLGKFSAKSYPVRNVFQGLLLYMIPWSFFIPFALIQFKERWRDLLKNSSFMYLLFCFLSFFTLWLIPSQRSHHYAIPSLPFALMITYLLVFKDQISIRHYRLWNLGNRLNASMFLLILIILFVPYGFNQILDNYPLVLSLAFTQLTLVLAIISFLIGESRMRRYVSSLAVLGSLWVLLVPKFSLPSLPSRVVERISDGTLGVVVAKPYFISEALGREVVTINDAEFTTYVKTHDHYYLVHRKFYEANNLSQLTSIVDSWPIWIRGREISDIWQALRKKDLSLLQEDLLLLRNISP